MAGCRLSAGLTAFCLNSALTVFDITCHGCCQGYKNADSGFYSSFIDFVFKCQFFKIEPVPFNLNTFVEEAP